MNNYFRGSTMEKSLRISGVGKGWEGPSADLDVLVKIKLS
jgi:hypothetical protein